MFNKKVRELKNYMNDNYALKFVFEGCRDQIVRDIRIVDKQTQKHKKTLDKLLEHLDLEPCARCVGDGDVINVVGGKVCCSKCDGAGFHCKEGE